MPPHPPASADLAVATICTDGFANHRHEPAFRILPGTPFRNVEFNLWYDELLAPAYVQSLAARCEAGGLTPVCVQGTAFGGEGAHGVRHDYAHKLLLLQIARQLGCRRVKCTGAPRDTQGGVDHVVEVVRRLAPVAADLDVLLLLENHDRNVLQTLGDFERILDAVDAPHVGLCLDTGHFEGAGIPLADVVRRFRPRILQVDLKDCAAFGRGHATVPFGEGTTQFDPFLDDLLAGGFRGFLTVEQAWNIPREPLVDNLTAAYRRFERFVRDPAALAATTPR